MPYSAADAAAETTGAEAHPGFLGFFCSARAETAAIAETAATLADFRAADAADLAEAPVDSAVVAEDSAEAVMADSEEAADAAAEDSPAAAAVEDNFIKKQVKRCQ